jgi:hypothetical protein
VHAQLLTVPVYVWATIAYFILAFSSDHFELRGPFFLVASGFLMVGYIMMLATESLAARYAAVFMLAVGVYSTVCNHTQAKPPNSAILFQSIEFRSFLFPVISFQESYQLTNPIDIDRTCNRMA